MIQVDGLQLSGNLQALGKGILPGLQDFVADLVVQACQEELMLEELGHVIHAFEFGLGHSGNDEPDGGHCGRYVVCQAFVPQLTW